MELREVLCIQCTWGMKTFYYTHWSWSRGGFKCWLYHVGMLQFTVQSDDFKRVVVPLQSIVYSLTFTWIKQDSRIEGISQQTNVNGHSFMKNADTLERAPTLLFGKYVKCTNMRTIIIGESLLRHSGGFWTPNTFWRHPTNYVPRGDLSWAAPHWLSWV